MFARQLVTPMLAGTTLRRNLSSGYQRALTLEKMNSRVRDAQYAVRGRQVLLAGQLDAKIAADPDHGLPFDEMIYCNIGNPQNLGQKPITFFREVMSLITHPDLLADEKSSAISELFAPDAIARAKLITSKFAGGIGQYSASQGIGFVRENVADFIARRDGYPSDANNIFLSNGASEAICNVLQALVRDDNDGVFIPIPQYPLYSATLTLIGAPALSYALDESSDWGLHVDNLEKSYADAVARGIEPRGLVVINPGNPTGQVLSEQNMIEILQFCYEKNVVLLADEVYQENVYDSKQQWRSFKSVLMAQPPQLRDNVELASFHSTSKGFLGECGFRGGYMELTNIDPEVADELLKKASMSLCSNVPGQIMVDLMVKPPAEGDHSYMQYVSERDGILASLKRRAAKLAEAFNSLEGYSCNPAQGAMYVFPRVRLPASAIQHAEELGIAPDAMYAEELLTATGICVVPGSGFGQEENTFHFRTTFLPAEDKMDAVIVKMTEFNSAFMTRFGGAAN
jgi:alanine transaminase